MHLHARKLKEFGDYTCTWIFELHSVYIAACPFNIVNAIKASKPGGSVPQTLRFNDNPMHACRFRCTVRPSGVVVHFEVG
jgi:hypothetical protein